MYFTSNNFLPKILLFEYVNYLSECVFIFDCLMMALAVAETCNEQ